MAREPTLGEVADDLRELRDAVDKNGDELRRAVDRLTEQIAETYVRKDVYEARHGTLIDRVAKVEERQTWSTRTAVTALLLPILVAVIVALVLTGGGR